MTQQDDDLQGGGPRPGADHSAGHSPGPSPGPDDDAGPPGQPHDALFKAILSVPEYLIAILR